MPHRYGFLYDKIADTGNCRTAILNASKEKRSVAYIADIIAPENLDRYAEELAAMLKNKTYTPSRYVEKHIGDGARQKKRTIKVPKFWPDQCLHWAVMQIVAPIIERSNYEYNCGSMPGKGAHHGIKYIQHALKDDPKGTKYAAQLDIYHCYEQVDHQQMRAAFRWHIKCPDTLAIMDLILDSMGGGLAIGYYPSQWFINLLLSPLDHAIKQHILPDAYYVRYIDDLVLLDGNKKKLHKAVRAISADLTEIGLTVKPNWQVFKIDSRPLDFLGYRFSHGYTRIRKRNMLRMARRIRKMRKKIKLVFQDASAAISYMGILKHCDSFNFRQRWVYPFISIKKCKEVIASESRKRNNAATIRDKTEAG